MLYFPRVLPVAWYLGQDWGEAGRDPRAQKCQEAPISVPILGLHDSKDDNSLYCVPVSSSTSSQPLPCAPR